VIIAAITTSSKGTCQQSSVQRQTEISHNKLLANSVADYNISGGGALGGDKLRA